MFKFNINDQEISIDFEYFDSKGKLAKPSSDDKFLTVCTIYDNANQIIAKGNAIRNPEDKFVKEIGRKKSLTRALREFDRNTRAQYWQAYLSRKGNNKPLILSQEKYENEYFSPVNVNRDNLDRVEFLTNNTLV